MSAFVVNKRHIDAMVDAGLRPGRVQRSDLRWLVPAPVNEHAYAEGEPWGPEAVSDYKARSRELTTATADSVGQMLWAENVRSVNHRYAEEEWEEIYTYQPHARRYTPVEILSAIDCYEYQSCEHPGWESSEARAFCDALRGHMIRSLPGYEAAAWEITDA